MVETHKYLICGQQKPGYSLPVDPKYFVEPDPISDMLETERRDLLDRIDTLEDHVKSRKELMYTNLSHIDENTSQLGQTLSRTMLLHPYDVDEVSKLERELFNLENQKRMEKTNTWRDIWNVSKELLELMKEYQQLRKRENFLK